MLQIKIFEAYKDFALRCSPALYEIDDVCCSRDFSIEGKGWMLLRNGRGVERGLKTQRLKTSWQTSWTSRLLMSREGGRGMRRGMEKICSPLPMAGRKLKKLCAGDGSANYLLLYRFARTPANRDAMRCDATRRRETRRDETSFLCNFSWRDRW